MLEKRVIIGAVTILADGQLQVRTDTLIEDDGVELARTHHRHVVEPDADPSTLSGLARQVADACWTPGLVVAFKIAKAQRKTTL